MQYITVWLARIWAIRTIALELAHCGAQRIGF